MEEVEKIRSEEIERLTTLNVRIVDIVTQLSTLTTQINATIMQLRNAPLPVVVSDVDKDKGVRGKVSGKGK